MALMCLGIGLVLRDLWTNQFELGEDSSDEGLDDSVKHLKHSRLGWPESQVLLRCCQDIRRDIRLCFNEEQEPETPTPPRPKPKTPRNNRKPDPPRRKAPKRGGTRQTAAAPEQ